MATTLVRKYIVIYLLAHNVLGENSVRRRPMLDTLMEYNPNQSSRAGPAEQTSSASNLLDPSLRWLPMESSDREDMSTSDTLDQTSPKTPNNVVNYYNEHRADVSVKYRPRMQTRHQDIEPEASSSLSEAANAEEYVTNALKMRNKYIKFKALSSEKHGDVQEPSFTESMQSAPVTKVINHNPYQSSQSVIAQNQYKESSPVEARKPYKESSSIIAKNQYKDSSSVVTPNPYQGSSTVIGHNQYKDSSSGIVPKPIKVSLPGLVMQQSTKQYPVSDQKDLQNIGHQYNSFDHNGALGNVLDFDQTNAVNANLFADSHHYNIQLSEHHHNPHGHSDDLQLSEKQYTESPAHTKREYLNYMEQYKPTHSQLLESTVQQQNVLSEPMFRHFYDKFNIHSTPIPLPISGKTEYGNNDPNINLEMTMTPQVVNSLSNGPHGPVTLINGVPVANPYQIDIAALETILGSRQFQDKYKAIPMTDTKTIEIRTGGRSLADNNQNIPGNGLNLGNQNIPAGHGQILGYQGQQLEQQTQNIDIRSKNSVPHVHNHPVQYVGIHDQNKGVQIPYFDNGNVDVRNYNTGIENIHDGVMNHDVSHVSLQSKHVPQKYHYVNTYLNVQPQFTNGSPYSHPVRLTWEQSIAGDNNRGHKGDLQVSPSNHRQKLVTPPTKKTNQSSISSRHQRLLALQKGGAESNYSHKKTKYLPELDTELRPPPFHN